MADPITNSEMDEPEMKDDVEMEGASGDVDIVEAADYVEDGTADTELQDATEEPPRRITFLEYARETANSPEWHLTCATVTSSLRSSSSSLARQRVRPSSARIRTFSPNRLTLNRNVQSSRVVQAYVVARGTQAADAQANTHQPRRIDLPEDDLEAMGSFLEYLYNGEYFPRRIGNERDGPLEADPSIPVPDNTGAQLLKHARVYTLAGKFFMPVRRKSTVHRGITVANILGLRHLNPSHIPKSIAQQVLPAARSPTPATFTHRHPRTTLQSVNLSLHFGLRAHTFCDTRPKRNSAQCV